MGEAVLLLNPAAGGGGAERRRDEIERALRTEAELSFETRLTQAPGDAARLAAEAAAAGCELLVVAGGDGTFNEAANGLLSRDDGEPPLLVLVPCGSGGDLPRALGLPQRIGPAVRIAREGTERRLDVGVIESGGKRRFFLNVAGVGFDAVVAAASQGGLKRFSPTAAYLAALLRTLYTYHPRGFRVSGDGFEYEGGAWAVVVANGSYFGGGMHIAPGAELDDGILDIVVIGDVGRAELVWNLPRIYRGTLAEHPRVEQGRSRQIRIEAAESTPIETDGEAIGDTPVTISLLPGALRVMV